MRPNYAQDAPPASIEVGGAAYPCETDYRVWLEVLRRLGELRLGATDEEAIAEAAQQILDLQKLVFGGVLSDENPLEVIMAISAFSKGYPTAPVRGREHQPTFSFEYDLNEIIIAIRNQHGIDLSYRRTEPFHWWEFLLLFRTLCGEHYILNVMDIRGYKGKDAEMRRRKQDYALPDVMTAAEKKEYEAFDAMFEDDYSDEGTEEVPAE